jgi:hypothetical protein
VKWDILYNEENNSDDGSGGGGGGDDYDDNYFRKISDKQNLYVPYYKHLSQNVSVK